MLALGVLIALLVFGRSTRRVKERFSDETRWYERPRIVGRLYGVMVLVSLLVQLFSGAGWRQILIVVTVIRILGIALLAGSVLLAWARVLRLAADSAALSQAAAIAPPPASRYNFPPDASASPSASGYDAPDQPTSGGYDAFGLPTSSGYDALDQSTSSGYGAPDQPTSSGYGAPDQPTSSGYDAPDQPTSSGYGAPDQSTSSGYDAPAETWPPPSPIVEQSRGLAPHKAPLTAQASAADWNPHHWDPEIEDDINRRRRG